MVARPTPCCSVDDQLGIITKVIPRFGTTTGVGGHVDFYIPNGTTVMDVGYMIPDGSGGFIKAAMKGQSPIAIGAGPIGAKVTPPLNGLVLGPNINGVSQAAVDATSNLDRGTIAGVYGDTGIFYATSPETAWESYAPRNSALTLTNNSGDVIVPLNKWDAEQLVAYGVKGSNNVAGGYPAAPIIDPEDGRGNAPWGLAAGLAGPESGYKWSFDLDYWNNNATDPSRMKNSIEVGPWNRIKYDGSRISFDQPGLTSTVLGYASINGANVGAVGPLPSTSATTGQTDLTSPKVVRWAVGQLILERPEYVWVKVRVDNPGPGFLDANGCPFFHSGTFGGDAGGTNNGKDHLWRYYEPSTFTWNGCLAAGKPASVEFTKPGDTIQFKIKIYNLGTQTQTNVVVKDTLPSGVTFLSAVPAQNSGPNPLVWNVGTLKPGQSFSSVVSVKVTGTGPLDNILNVTSDQGSQTVEETVESGTSVYLVPTKSASPTTVAPGATVTYNILVRNLGAGTTGSPVTLQEFLPPGFTYQSLVSVYVNGALVTGTTVNNANPNQPVFTVPVAIQGAKELKLAFTALVGPAVPAGTYCNTYSVTENSIPTTTGSQGCVDVGAGTIGDTVYRDWNGNGIQDPGEDEGLVGRDGEPVRRRLPRPAAARSRRQPPTPTASTCSAG